LLRGQVQDILSGAFGTGSPESSTAWKKPGLPLKRSKKLGTGRLRAAVIDGDVDFGSVMAGQSAAMVERIQPAEEIIRELFGGTGSVLSRLKQEFFG